MKTKLAIATMGAAALLFSSQTLADERIPAEDLPENVKSALDDYFADAKILEVERDKKRSGDEYEVKIQYKELVLEVEVSAEGEILEVETD